MEVPERRLKVLVSAYACEPGKGSEPGVGWNVAGELSSRVNLTVVTRPNNRATIEASGEEWIKEVQWIYWDPPKWLTFWKKGGRGIQIFYMLWQAGVGSAVRKRINLEEVDILHHLTFGKYWIPSSLATLPVPFVFGPVGGGEVSPAGLGSESGWRGRIADIAKSAVRTFVHRFSPYRRLYHAAAWNYAATAQTEDALRSLGINRVSILPQSGIRPEDLSGVFAKAGNKQPMPPPLKLVTAARLIHWKGIDLAIEAVAVASKSVDVRLVVLQTGPELQNLKGLAKKLKLDDRIEFKGRLPSLESVYEEIAGSHALVHPALHEAFGQACIESLGLGVPVICLDWGGPGLIVDDETGFAVKPGNRQETVKRLAEAMKTLSFELQSGHSRADACKSRAFVVFHWENLADSIVTKYREVLGS